MKNESELFIRCSKMFRSIQDFFIKLKKRFNRNLETFSYWPVNYAEKFQSVLIRLCVVSNDFENLSKGVSNNRRLRLSAVFFIFHVLLGIHSFLCMILIEESHHQLIGNASYTLGAVGKVIFFPSFMGALCIIAFRAMMFFAEFNGNLTMFTDFRIMINHTYAGSAIRLKLSPENLDRFRLRVKLSFHFVRITLTNFVIIVICLFGWGVVAKMIHPESFWQTAKYIFVFIMIFFHCVFLSTAIWTLCFLWYLAGYYLRLRFRQVAGRFREMSQNAKTDGVSSSKLFEAIQEHHNICQVVLTYNRVSKWITSVYHYFCAPIIGGLLFVIVFVKTDFAFQCVLFALVLQILFAVYFFSSRASGIYVDVRSNHLHSHAAFTLIIAGPKLFKRLVRNFKVLETTSMASSDESETRSLMLNVLLKYFPISST